MALMAVEISERIQEIARERGLSESEVLEQALERGVEDLYRDLVLCRYLQGDLSREEAVDAIGPDVVQRADREVEAMTDDVAWGSGA